MTERLHFHFSLSCIGEGNGNPLQCSCLEEPSYGGAWWAAVSGVAQSRTRLKQLSMHAYIGEGNGSPLQCSCLENSRDRGAWWAAIYGVKQSRTRLKRLSSSSKTLSTGWAFQRESSCPSYWELPCVGAGRTPTPLLQRPESGPGRGLAFLEALPTLICLLAWPLAPTVLQLPVLNRASMPHPLDTLASH